MRQDETDTISRGGIAGFQRLNEPCFLETLEADDAQFLEGIARRADHFEANGRGKLTIEGKPHGGELRPGLGVVLWSGEIKEVHPPTTTAIDAFVRVVVPVKKRSQDVKDAQGQIVDEAFADWKGRGIFPPACFTNAPDLLAACSSAKDPLIGGFAVCVEDNQAQETAAVQGWSPPELTFAEDVPAGPFPQGKVDHNVIGETLRLRPGEQLGTAFGVPGRPVRTKGWDLAGRLGPQGETGEAEQGHGAEESHIPGDRTRNEKFAFLVGRGRFFGSFGIDGRGRFFDAFREGFFGLLASGVEFLNGGNALAKLEGLVGRLPTLHPDDEEV